MGCLSSKMWMTDWVGVFTSNSTQSAGTRTDIAWTAEFVPILRISGIWSGRLPLSRILLACRIPWGITFGNRPDTGLPGLAVVRP
jgi:hypothetical protein